MLDLACIGDSIVHGVGVLPTFCDRLGGTNYGVPGTSSRDWSPDLGGSPEVVYPDTLDVATLLLGANDALGFLEPVPVPPEEFGKNLEAIVDELLRLGSARVLLALPDVPPEGLEPSVTDRLLAYRPEVDRLCEARVEIECVPPFAIPREFFLTPFHVDARGHAVIADVIEAVLVPEPCGWWSSLAALLGLAGLGRGR